MNDTEQLDISKIIEEENTLSVLDRNTSLRGLKNSYELVKFFLYRYIFSPSIIYIYLFPITFFVLLSFMPMFYSSLPLFATSITFSVLITYGITFYIIRESTLYKNLENTGLKKSSIYFSIFILICITSILILLYIVVVIILMGLAGYLAEFFYPPLPPESRYFGESTFLLVNSGFTSVSWDIFAYFFFGTVLFTFVVALFFQTIAKTLKSFIMLSISYVVISLFCCNEIFYSYAPIFMGEYSPDHSIFYVDPSSVYSIDMANQIISIYPQRIAMSGTNNDVFLRVQPPTGFNGSDFSFFWWFTLLFPSNFINTFGFPIFSNVSVKEATVDVPVVMYNGIAINGWHLNYEFFRVNNPEWLFIIIWPYFLCFAYGSFALLISSKS